MRHDLVAVSGSSARAMAPKRKYDAARLEEAVQKAVEAHKKELEKKLRALVAQTSNSVAGPTYN